jgi:hypothetical protein
VRQPICYHGVPYPRTCEWDEAEEHDFVEPDDGPGDEEDDEDPDA